MVIHPSIVEHVPDDTVPWLLQIKLQSVLNSIEFLNVEYLFANAVLNACTSSAVCIRTMAFRLFRSNLIRIRRPELRNKEHTELFIIEIIHRTISELLVRPQERTSPKHCSAVDERGRLAVRVSRTTIPELGYGVSARKMEQTAK